MFIPMNPDTGAYKLQATGASATSGEVVVEFATGVDATIGRGATDTDITYIKLRNSAGTACYVYPDTAGTAIVVSATKP